MEKVKLEIGPIFRTGGYFNFGIWPPHWGLWLCFYVLACINGCIKICAGKVVLLILFRMFLCFLQFSISYSFPFFYPLVLFVLLPIPYCIVLPIRLSQLLAVFVSYVRWIYLLGWMSRLCIVIFESLRLCPFPALLCSTDCLPHFDWVHCRSQMLQRFTLMDFMSSLTSVKARLALFCLQ